MKDQNVREHDTDDTTAPIKGNDSNGGYDVGAPIKDHQDEAWGI